MYGQISQIDKIFCHLVDQDLQVGSTCARAAVYLALVTVIL